MSEPFLSEIKIFSFGFPPKGWATCSGQLLPIDQNQGLFSLLGTTYGGDGRVNFGLPNLQGRVSMHMGTGHVLGEMAGETAHTLSISELPQHAHSAKAASQTTDTSPAQHYWAPDVTGNLTFATSVNTALAPGAISATGGSQAHTNQQPFLTLNFCIALQGIFPSQT